ncbi:methyl-CpG-binding domain protein 1 [Chiroxiphia lanceolata]|uniref:methyl-CpG-binding domain protein 1 n=1 Tax=Chiroxiphia lanceolata TaxID=296741 RepID=UPI0013CF1997|nr:methyl-CpG-binding domain protein 1 [Chiroxiphia lanceolata]
MGTPPPRMAEGWADCPALGPGWQRREAFRKSGATSGRSDTYYRSPTGQKFRSKIELRRYLGPGHDLSNFDFKSGLERAGTPRTRKGPKWRLPVGRPLNPPETPREEEEEGGGAEAEEAPPLLVQAPPLAPPAVATPPPPTEPTPLITVAPPPPTEAPPPPEPPVVRRTRKRIPPEPPQDGAVVLCAGCQSLFPGVSLPPQRRCRWLCPDCRAQRRDFNREQRFYKRVGCGSCQACRIPEDCGICSACTRSPPGGPPGPAWPHKCLLRRCLRIVKKGLGCGSCPGCLSTEDCGSCCICLRRLQPGLKRQWRCLRRRCLRPKKSRAAKKTQMPQALTEKWKPSMKQEPSDNPSTRHKKPLTKGKEKKKPGRPPKPPGPRRGVRSRASRRCGVCAACRRPADCGRCDFCQDKPKFGGQNLKRQKCRWRQCLRCAMVKEDPLGGPEQGPGPLPGPPLRLCPIKEEVGPLPRLEVRPPGRLGPPLEMWGPPPTPPAPQDPQLGLLIASAPRLKGAPPEPSVAPPPPPPGDLGVLIAATPRVKQEQPQPSASLVPVPPRPPPAPLVVLSESEEEEEEEEEGGCRVALPLPPAPPPPWPGSFLEELLEIPLPAHWGVVGGGPGGGRGLRLVQRCPRSPMAAAAVLLNPGLAFRVLVARGRPVPPGHEVLARRPPLRSVLDLVELLCDLEAYGPCPGPPGGPPGPRCHVLVRGGRCCRPCLATGGD